MIACWFFCILFQAFFSWKTNWIRIFHLKIWKYLNFPIEIDTIHFLFNSSLLLFPFALLFKLFFSNIGISYWNSFSPLIFFKGLALFLYQWFLCLYFDFMALTFRIFGLFVFALNFLWLYCFNFYNLWTLCLCIGYHFKLSFPIIFFNWLDFLFPIVFFLCLCFDFKAITQNLYTV